MEHDQIFKELLQAFFGEFLELFYPATAARLDFTGVTFLSEEVFTSPRRGRPRRVDVVAQVPTLDGAPLLIGIHVEVQRRRRAEFGQRMHEYYVLLRRRYRIPFLPIAMFLTGTRGGVGEEEYVERALDHETLRFRYRRISLASLPAEEYREQSNPLGPALAALMRFSGESRPRHKVRSLQRTARWPMEDERRALLVNIIDRYLILDDTEAEEFETLLKRQELTEVGEMLTTYEERGLIRGRAEGKRDAVMLFARARFGPAAQRLESLVTSAATEAELNALIERLSQVESVEELLGPH